MYVIYGMVAPNVRLRKKDIYKKKNIVLILSIYKYLTISSHTCPFLIYFNNPLYLYQPTKKYSILPSSHFLEWFWSPLYFDSKAWCLSHFLAGFYSIFLPWFLVTECIFQKTILVEGKLQGLGNPVTINALMLKDFVSNVPTCEI